MARCLRTSCIGAAVTALAFVAVPRTAQAQQPAHPRRAPPPAPVSSPAPPDLPPPPPPPWTAHPDALPLVPPPGAVPAAPATTATGVVTGGASPLMPLAPAAPASAPPPDALERERARHLAELELRVRQEEVRHERADREQEKWWGWTRKVHFSGYLQPQLLWQWYDSSASPNLVNGALPAGVGSNSVIAKASPLYGNSGPALTTNGDYFRLRRARLKLEFEPSEWSRLVMEIDPTLAGGPDNATGTIARNVEAQGIARWSDDVVTTFGMGIFKIPFGFELLQTDADRPFIERSWWERNVTPGEFDTGAKAYTTAMHDRLAVQVAVVNGATQGEKTFSLLPDLNQGKDLVGRVNYDFGPFDVGTSGYYGQGQEVVLSSLVFKQFPRWAWNLEAALHHRFFAIGETRAFAELDLGQNMDRAVNYSAAIALPGLPQDIANGSVVNRDEMGYWIRVEQDVTRWATAALRYDYYSPDTSQGTNGRDTYGVVGVVHFARPLQLMVEYDHFIDNVHAAGAQPAGKHGDVLSTVLQVRYP